MCSIWTLEALLENDPLSSYLFRYKGDVRRSPGISWTSLEQKDLILRTVRYRLMLSDANQSERLNRCDERLAGSWYSLGVHSSNIQLLWQNAINQILLVMYRKVVFKSLSTVSRPKVCPFHFSDYFSICGPRGPSARSQWGAESSRG